METPDHPSDNPQGDARSRVGDIPRHVFHPFADDTAGWGNSLDGSVNKPITEGYGTGGGPMRRLSGPPPSL